MMKKIWNHIINPEHLVIALMAVAMLGVGWMLIVNIGFLNPVAEAIDDFSMTDVLYKIENAEPSGEVSEAVTLVDITPVYDRGAMADILGEISLCNPKAVGIDVIFEGVKTDSVGNAYLTETAAQMPSATTIFAEKLTDYSADNEEFQSVVRSFFADSVTVNQGFTNLLNDMTGTPVREMPTAAMLDGKEVYPFAVALCEAAGIKVADKSADNDFLINYENVDFVIVPADSIMEYSDLIEDRIIIVGAMHEESDMHATPVGKMPGAKIHAYSVTTLLEHKRPVEIGTTMLVVMAIIVCWLIELCISLFYRVLRRKEGGMVRMFFASSSLVRDATISVALLMLCFLVFVLFIYHNIILDAAVIFGSIAILPMAMELYEPMVNVLYKKKGIIWLKNHSNYIDE